MIAGGRRVPLRLKRTDRVRKIQRLQHGFAAALLLAGAYRQTAEPGAHRLLAVAEALAALAVVLFVVRGTLSRRSTHARLGWVEIFGAVLVFLEGYERHRYAKRFFLFHPEALSALALLASGLFEERLAEIRYIEASDTGIALRLNPWKRRRFRWEDLRRIRRTPAAIVFESDGAPFELALTRLSNAVEVTDWVAAIAAEKGLEG